MDFPFEVKMYSSDGEESFKSLEEVKKWVKKTFGQPPIFSKSFMGIAVYIKDEEDYEDFLIGAIEPVYPAPKKTKFLHNLVR